MWIVNMYSMTKYEARDNEQSKTIFCYKMSYYTTTVCVCVFVWAMSPEWLIDWLTTSN